MPAVPYSNTRIIRADTVFKKRCQKDFAIGPLFKVDLGKVFFLHFYIFLYFIREWLILAEYSQKQ